MTTVTYDLVVSELLEDEPEFPNTPDLSLLNTLETSTRMTILKKALTREKFKKNRCGILFYLYQMGKVIFSQDLTLKESGLTRHHYTTCERLYLIFEKDETQIFRTKSMTTSNVMKLTVQEIVSLTA